MTAEMKLLERLTRRQILVQRFSGSQIKAALPIIRQLAKDLRKRIAAADATEFQMGRMVALERDIQALVATATGDIQGALDLEDFAVQEAQFTQKLLGASVSIDLAEGLDLDAIRAITTRRQMRLVSGNTVKTLTIPQMWQEFSEAAGRDAMRVVQAGVLEGKTQQQMSRAVAELVTTRSRRQAETVVRTAVNGIGGAARNDVYTANSDILEGERFLAVLDSRTTLTCSGIESRNDVYPVGQGPMPPMHYGCRSVRIPVVKSEYRIATQGERASYEGPVSNQLRYGGFLKRQSKEFQDDVLGPKRAELFRSGKLKMEQFTDDQGRVLSLDDLASRYDLAMG
jgi:SPP1 gp7 family putative phage head morphogenesis protein